MPKKGRRDSGNAMPLTQEEIQEMIGSIVDRGNAHQLSFGGDESVDDVLGSIIDHMGGNRDGEDDQ